MRLKHDPEADAVYITLREDVPFARGFSMDAERVIDFGADGQPRGVELLNVSYGVDVRGVPEEVAIAALLRQHGIRVLSRTEAARYA